MGNLGGTKVRKLLICAAALSGFAVQANAADLLSDAASVKDPLPDTLTYKGVTIYGTVDVGYAYQSAGVPLNGAYVGGLEYQAFTTTRNFHGSQSTIAESGLEQSKIGIKFEENIGYGLTAIGKLETGFNPLSGELTDACASMVRNSNTAYNQQTANADSSRCGQAFNSVAYAGLSSPLYGTLTVGRQNSLQLDALGTYDPQALSYAFSFLGYSGFNGGAGSTEAARWDNSVKYIFQYGPFHAAGMYSSGGADTGILGDAYGADVGVTYKGFSLDGVYQNVRGAVNLRSSLDDGTANNIPIGTLAAYISNDESWNIMGKYTYDLGGSFKDEGPSSKLTLFAGYSHIEKSRSSDYTASSYDSQGGYPISVGIDIIKPIEYDMEWAGAKYQTGPWSITGAYYHANQNSWTAGVGSNATTASLACAGGASNLLCAGDFNEGSLVVDYAFNKHFDVYTGVNYSQVTNGLAAGFSGVPTNGSSGSQDQTTFMSGLRLKF